MRTYIQISPPNHLIKVTPEDVTNSFIRQPHEGSRFYKIIPGLHGQAVAQRTARYTCTKLEAL